MEVEVAAPSVSLHVGRREAEVVEPAFGVGEGERCDLLLGHRDEHQGGVGSPDLESPPEPGLIEYDALARPVGGELEVPGPHEAELDAPVHGHLEVREGHHEVSIGEPVDVLLSLPDYLLDFVDHHHDVLDQGGSGELPEASPIFWGKALGGVGAEVVPVAAGVLDPLELAEGEAAVGCEGVEPIGVFRSEADVAQARGVAACFLGREVEATGESGEVHGLLQQRLKDPESVLIGDLKEDVAHALHCGYLPCSLTIPVLSLSMWRARA